MKKVFTVGIGGVTCGGKSTIVNRLSSTLSEAGVKYKIFRQDDFYIDQSKMTFIPTLNYHNWDEAKSVDFQRLYKSYEKDATKSIDNFFDVIIIEGHMILGNENLVSQMDLKYFIRGEFESIRQIRQQRTYDPPDVPGYFETYAWPAYLQHEKYISKIDNLHFLSAANLETNFQTISLQLLQQLSKNLIILSKKSIIDKLARNFAYGDNSGAVVSFEGIIRGNDQGKIIKALDYECYEKMARKILNEICEKVRKLEPEINRIVLIHRTGVVNAGETSFYVAVSSEHRKAAFMACQKIVDEVKFSVPIWKKEILQDDSTV